MKYFIYVELHWLFVLCDVRMLLFLQCAFSARAHLTAFFS